MVTQKLHIKEEINDVGISILQTPQRQQTTTTNLPQIQSLQGSPASLSPPFRPNPYLTASPPPPRMDYTTHHNV